MWGVLSDDSSTVATTTLATPTSIAAPACWAVVRRLAAGHGVETLLLLFLGYSGIL